MSYSKVPDEATGSTSPTGSPAASPAPKVNTASQQRPRPRPKLVSFGRDLPDGGRPTTEGRARVDFMEAVEENSPFTYSGRQMSREVDPLLKETMSPDEDDDDDDDWQGEQETEETKSSWFLFLLTFGGLGLQIGWSVETSNGSVGSFPSQLSRGPT
jgi:solute carrier family 45 protein 1/2/4